MTRLDHGTDRDVLDAVRALTEEIAARADEIERARRLPPDLVDALVAAGCFRGLVPREQGGSHVGLPRHIEMLEELAAADGSVGWTVMIGSQAPVVFGLLPRATFDAVYAGGPDVIVAGAFNPTGVATPVAGGFRVRGRWAFASGCQHAHRFIAHCFVDDGRTPPLRMALLRPEDVVIEDTWHVAGLRGTGSHDFVVDDVVVPDDHTFSLVEPQHCGDGPLWRIPELMTSTMMIAAVALGIARGALADIAALAAGKVPAFSGATLAASPLFQHGFGEAEARLRAAAAALSAEAGAAWARATAAIPLTVEDRARARATATWVTWTAAAIVDWAYGAGGGTSLYDASPLQRRLRDVHAVTQHFALKPDTYTLAGAVLTGQDVDTSFL
jgi:alkylation response protein AidB-like acyl-CoA dehydrogenase